MLMCKQILFLYILCCGTVSLQAQSIRQYEYWLDNDYSEKTSVYGGDTDISATVPLDGLSSGLHFFCFRATNDRGEVGNVYRTLFYLPESDPVDVAGYEYWLNGDETHKVSSTVSNPLLTLDIDVSELSEGMHTFSFRARNSFDKWGPVYTEEFVVTTTTAIERTKIQSERFDVYNLKGEKVLSNARWSDLPTLPFAIYLVQGRKILVK